ncbi:SMI1/KNR4 family protein [Yinghuangia seranimata]|uniref:SMI1/KNR4 family protein n=1 Tax=Yinghuangia seranimata TaxID=408067 RepID=UPI00248C3075|nr:SMI1/KNR4 family protein [Yinghuangia seranimata]MDI2130548.1 SMI1/KNR4 family protein [Yinghuangia seranimata]
MDIRLWHVLDLPGREPAAVDWGEVEAALGTALPADYKQVVGRYRELVVGGFIRILHPHGRRPGMDIVSENESNRAWIEFLAEEAELEDEQSPPYASFPHPGGILLWGVTTNGDYCYWVTNPQGPDSWNVVVSTHKGEQWTEFSGGFEEFLKALFLDRDSVSCFRRDWPGTDSISHFRE